MNRIMLRFRPIAPKPPGGVATPDAADHDGKNDAVRKGVKRTKRKYVRVRARQSKRKITEIEKSVIEDEYPPENGVITLQLLPERSESEKSCCNNNFAQKNTEHHEFTVNNDLTAEISGCSRVTVDSRSTRSPIDTWIVVENVTDTYIQSGSVGLGFSDLEKMRNLEVDTCPGFVSDGRNDVVWVNEAYRKMVGEERGEGVMVRLVLKEKIPYFYPSFACRVRVIQHTREGQKWNRIVPCDVWRMEFGGFAWRLDVNTALALGI